MHLTTPLFTSSPLPGRPSPGFRFTSCVIPSFLYQVLDYKPVSHQLRNFCLTLGTDLPWADYLYPGNLRLSANGFFIRFFVTHAGIFTCDTSTIRYHTASLAYTTLSYHPVGSVASVLCLAPLNCRRKMTQPVSYYALFEGMAASKPTSWLSLPLYILFHLA
jgi:hypothetical protein